MAQGMIMRRGGAAATGLPEFTYTGTSTFFDEEDGNWRIEFLTSGTLVFQKIKSAHISICCVGGGASGGTRHSSSAYNGGGGGGGGYVVNYGPVLVEVGVSYPVVIGAGGTAVSGDNKSGNDGGISYFGSSGTYYANGGIKGRNGDATPFGGNGGSGGGTGGMGTAAGSAGGTDGGNGAGTYPGYGQGTTTREFAEAGGTLYSTGGTGGSRDWTSPAGTANTGDGGGGGGTSSAAGGSGIVVIRNVRAV